MTRRVENTDNDLTYIVKGVDFREEREEVSRRFCDTPEFCSDVLLALFEEEIRNVRDPEQVLFLARDYELLVPIGYTSSHLDIIGLLSAIDHVRHLLKLYRVSDEGYKEIQEVREHIHALTLNHQSLYSLALSRIFEIVQDEPGDAAGLERYLSIIEEKFIES